jgi:predicted DNA-binding protein with PD1-like motif
MISRESRAGRRLVARLDRGASLIDTLLDVCRSHGVRSAEIRGVGALETVELTSYDQSAQAWKPGRSLGGGLEVLSLLGNVAEHAGQLAVTLNVVLGRDGDNGIEVLGGHVVRARTFWLEVFIDVLDDVLVRRGRDPATGVVSWSEGVVAAEPPPAGTAPPTWADVARASQGRPAESSPPVAKARVPAPADRVVAPDDDEEETDETLAPGDILIHPTFGRCDVQRIEGGYEFAQVRLRNGRLVRLSLDIVRLVRAGTEGGHRVFRARVDD